MLQGKGQYINGQWIKNDGKLLESINPAYGTCLWQGQQAGASDIAEAVTSAHHALDSWSALNFEQRLQCIQKFAGIIEKNREYLAQLISAENGKPLWEAYTEISAVVGKVDISIQAYQERTGAKKTATAEANAWLRFKQHGVVVVLGAFNFPAHLSNGHIVPALLAGNTVLYKPSEHTPAVAEFIMQCWHDSGIPPGVINCLQGEAAVAKALLSQDIQGVYFTGSYAAGLSIHQQFSNRPEVILALEMGGNNPLVVDEIDDIDAAVYQTVLSTMITSGQRCTCARRLIIPDTHSGNEFLQHFITVCSSLQIGAFDQQPEPFMGPVIHPNEAKKHLKAQEKLIALGGKPLLLMNHVAPETGFLSPGIIDMSAIAHPQDEEIFAPLVQVYRYRDFDEAIHRANQTRYGLAAGLLSDNETRYQQFYRKIRAGLINWNRPTTGASSNLPFGGVGLSGNHRPSAYFAADYCAYPVASMEQPHLAMPAQRLPGIIWTNK